MGNKDLAKKQDGSYHFLAGEGESLSIVFARKGIGGVMRVNLKNLGEKGYKILLTHYEPSIDCMQSPDSYVEVTIGENCRQGKIESRGIELKLGEVED